MDNTHFSIRKQDRYGTQVAQARIDTDKIDVSVIWTFYFIVDDGRWSMVELGRHSVHISVKFYYRERFCRQTEIVNWEENVSCFTRRSRSTMVNASFPYSECDSFGINLIFVSHYWSIYYISFAYSFDCRCLVAYASITKNRDAAKWTPMLCTNLLPQPPVAFHFRFN